MFLLWNVVLRHLIYSVFIYNGVEADMLNSTFTVLLYLSTTLR